MSKFFCPGRILLAGNYTERQKGRVMAAAVSRGITAEAEPNGENVIRVFSHGFDPVQVDLMKLWPEESDVGSSTSLVRGMAGILSEQLSELRGFDAFLTTELPTGGGLGSSAAYAVVTGCMIACFAGGEGLPPQELARAAQKAENRFFGKQSGLTDQMACALGGGVYMDLSEGKILPINCNFDALGLTLCLTETGGTGLPAGDDRASLGEDMAAVAQSFGEQFLAKVRASDFDEVWPRHREERPWRRARYFFDETWRASAMADALGLQDAGRYLELMNESGRGIEELLRDSRSAPFAPELTLGLETSARLLEGRGAWRIYGGSSGCIQALMPQDDYPRYRAAMEELFGPDSCQSIQISSRGVGLIEP